MSEMINPALAGQVERTTRQLWDGLEFRLRVFWLAEAPRIPFQGDPGPPPLVLGDPGQWVLDLSQADGTALVAGQALKSGVNVLAPFAGDPRYPGAGLGKLLAWDFGGLDRDPGRNDLDPGSTVRLVYVTASEVAAGA